MSVAILSDLCIDVLFDSCSLDTKNIVRTKAKQTSNVSKDVKHSSAENSCTLTVNSHYTSYPIWMSHSSCPSMNELRCTVHISLCGLFFLGFRITKGLQTSFHHIWNE